ncbi:hypothetical protein MtrunA17_Chr5g0439681 [Medicago truncatula]|uniref:DUF247 domain protein n=2 Tax=Medicago truncatula TaxID=3880 RepID=G7KCL7_MEDTR|nr:DUF247 domain protein [Medicago truncatula]RHN57374.1 hypothetical protein MtrunA17_Chr5g0439681 [Medicago truncatula]
MELKYTGINFETSETISLEVSEEDEDHLNRSAMELKYTGINFKSSETISLEVSEEDEDHLNQSAMKLKETRINFKSSETSLEVSEEDKDDIIELVIEDHEHALPQSAMVVKKTGINFKTSETSLKVSKEDEDHLNRSAMELKEAGISFKKSKTRSLKDVSFNRGVLRLPKLVVDDHTECMFLNLIAFELLHVDGTRKEVISFVCFIDTIIDSAVDVAILIRSGIIINYLESDKAVAKLFNSLAKEIPMDREGELEEVTKSMISYCKKPWKSWRASLIQTYFRNPWAMVSLVAAFFLFALTIIQTIYTVGQFYQKD